jgi:hypothetical protein
MLHIFITFYLVWCNVLMHIYIYICLFVCAYLYLLCVANRSRFVSELRGIDGQALATKGFSSSSSTKFEDTEHLFGEGKCPLTHYVSFTFNSASRIT